jgi:hypothetical protein
LLLVEVWKMHLELASLTHHTTPREHYLLLTRGGVLFEDDDGDDVFRIRDQGIGSRVHYSALADTHACGSYAV